jgi:predicted RNA-binding Zn-ribbon protein involved in translation (DUF1610 family)
MFKKLESNIIHIITDNNETLKGKFEVKKINYYNRKILSLFINGVRLSNRNNKVSYECPTCGREVTLLLKRFLSKKTIYCRVCKEHDKDKRKNQSLFIKNSFQQYNKVKSKYKKPKHKIDIIKESIKKWIVEDINFKDNYIKRILTEKEFFKIKNNILIKDKKLTNFTYFAHLITNNQHKFAPYIDIEGELISFSEYSGNVKFICESCGKKFKGRNFKTKLKNKKILCKDCLFCNKIFKIKYTYNINNEKIRFQSKIEKSLINYCNFNHILIQNGPKVLYFFKEKQRTNNVDFKIDDILIETKDNHIWHKNEVDSGKWKLKSDSAKKYCENNNMIYELIFPKDIEKFKKSLNT